METQALIHIGITQVVTGLPIKNLVFSNAEWYKSPSTKSDNAPPLIRNQTGTILAQKTYEESDI
jgi:hypothetical protein